MLLGLFGRQEGAFFGHHNGFHEYWPKSRDFVVLTQHQLEPTTSPFNMTMTIQPQQPLQQQQQQVQRQGGQQEWGREGSRDGFSV